MGVSEYVTVATILAPADRVWAILDGHLAGDARFTARVRLGTGAVRSVSMKVTLFEPPSRMEWTGGLPLGLFVGRRMYTVTPRVGVTEFRMQLNMTGLLAPLIIRSVGDRQTEIDSFSAALKKRAETG